MLIHKPFLNRVLPATIAVAGALAVAAPVAGAVGTPAATAGASDPSVCAQVTAAGPWAVLGPYGVLGAYGPLGSKYGQPNPAANCGSGGPAYFGVPAFANGSYITSNLSLTSH